MRCMVVLTGVTPLPQHQPYKESPCDWYKHAAGSLDAARQLVRRSSRKSRLSEEVLDSLHA